MKDVRLKKVAISSFFMGLAMMNTIIVSNARADLIEPPVLISKVQEQKLPPIEQRVPNIPSVAKTISLGKHGGELKMLIGRSKDIRLMVVYGYARLVGYNTQLELEPDILKDIEITDNRVFTLHLRKGHKWSDGHPFTAEDFRYWWEDVANNKKLSPAGPPVDMLLDGEPPTFEVLDAHTVRYTWSGPKIAFLRRLASASPLFIYRPAHYLKGFHIKYTSEEKLKKLPGKSRSWAARHNRKDNLYKFDNPDLPTLQPWVNTTALPATRFVFKRNPFYHRIDSTGKQLPYIDRVVFSQASASLIAAKAGSGEVDLQARNIELQHFPFLKQGEERNGYKTFLWKEAKGAHIALFPNLNVNDKTFRELFRNVKFRRALSLGVDREMINEALYFGLGVESNNTILPDSPLYKEEYTRRWASFDLEQANNLLDDLGLSQRNDKNIRILADGRPLEIIVETAGESAEETDVLELIKEGWAEIGIKLYSKPSQREVLRNRIFSGETMMAIWSGLENGVPTAEFEPKELGVTSQHQYQWPKWGQYVETGGRSGESVDMDSVRKLVSLHRLWLESDDESNRTKIWQQMLSIHANQVFSIGIVAGVRQPIVVKNSLRNIPAEGIYNWDPGAHFGIYRPDTFWFVK